MILGSLYSSGLVVGTLDEKENRLIGGGILVLVSLPPLPSTYPFNSAICLLHELF
jgi:hypothetical protein